MRKLKGWMYISGFVGVGMLGYIFYKIITKGDICISENNPYILWFEFILMIVFLINMIIQFWKESKG